MTPVLLDISRLVSRADFPIPTGIDRVERAYFSYFIAGNRPIRFLTRIAGGFAVIDRQTAKILLQMVQGQVAWGQNDLIGCVFSRKKGKLTQRAESTIRRLALDTCRKPGLAALLQKMIDPGFTYINVGHSNRNADLWASLEAAGVGRSIAMIHDVIPLDYPQFCRQPILDRFEKELVETGKNCAFMIYNSTHTAQRSQHWLAKWGVEPDYITALLGVDPLPDVGERQIADHPYFIILGTIEPRKNHRLLLDIWQDMVATMPSDRVPHLHIVGRRGWRNDDIFEILDTAAMMGTVVFEHNNLDDDGLARLMNGARALLFPSFAEGFGYPLIEALQKKIPAICSNLPCFQEISGDLPVYLDSTDQSGWKNEIVKQSTADIDNKTSYSLDFPTWEQHFHKIDTII